MMSTGIDAERCASGTTKPSGVARMGTTEAGLLEVPSPSGRTLMPLPEGQPTTDLQVRPSNRQNQKKTSS